MTIAELPHFSNLYKDWQTYRACPAEIIDRYRSVLPAIVVDSWQAAGFQRFGKGFLWTVNPDEFREIAADFLHEYQVPDVHVLLRTGFGDLIFLYRGKSFHLSAVTLKHGQLAGGIEEILEVHLGQRDFANSIFFLKEFKGARKALGDLAEDEVYGLAPALPLGGPLKTANMRKLNLRAYLHLLSRL
jgi:hypothetical protein